MHICHNIRWEGGGKGPLSSLMMVCMEDTQKQGQGFCPAQNFFLYFYYAILGVYPFRGLLLMFRVMWFITVLMLMVFLDTRFSMKLFHKDSVSTLEVFNIFLKYKITKLGIWKDEGNSIATLVMCIITFKKTVLVFTIFHGFFI